MRFELPRSWPHRLALGAIALVMIELLSLGTLAVLERTMGIGYRPSTSTVLTAAQRASIEKLLAGGLDYLAYSTTLGWTIKPDAKDITGIYASNAQALRADRPTAAVPAAGTLRIAAFGGSSTHGDGVRYQDTWEEQLAARVPNTEVLNFGVPGYGADQAYLRYQVEGIDYHAHLVLIGFTSDDIYRHVNSFVPFYERETGMPFAKPRYRLHNGRPSLVPNPLPHIEDYARLLQPGDPIWGSLLAVDPYARLMYGARPYDRLATVRLAKVVRRLMLQRLAETNVLENGMYKVRSLGFDVTLKILETFARKAIDRDTLPIVVMFPTCADITAFARTGTTPYAPLLDIIRADRYRILDLMPAFTGGDAAPEELCRSQYTAAGNGRVAALLAGYLQRERLIDPAIRIKLLREERLARGE
jgi:hypothetical protein